VWSTADTTTGAQHFDGIIDPACWYDSSGKLLPGTFTNSAGATVASWDGVNSLTAARSSPPISRNIILHRMRPTPTRPERHTKASTAMSTAKARRPCPAR
jgi:hypothetical protein